MEGQRVVEEETNDMDENNLGGEIINLLNDALGIANQRGVGIISTPRKP